MPRKLIFVHPSSARVFPQGTDGQFYSFLVPSFNPIWVPCERLVVCEDEELSAFQHQAKVAKWRVDSQQLPVTGLSRRQLL